MLSNQSSVSSAQLAPTATDHCLLITFLSIGGGNSVNDYLLRILTDAGDLRAVMAHSTGLTREVATRHRASPLATAALGYGLAGAALLGALLKVQQRVVIKAAGNGPLGKLIAESDSYGHSRAYTGVPQLSSTGPITSEYVAQAVGNDGFLTVVRDLGLEEPHQSTVPLQTGFLDADWPGFWLLWPGVCCPES